MTDQPSPRPNGFSEATGEICYDLPSSYIPHRATGLLHLPRFLAKARKHLKGELPPPINVISVRVSTASFAPTLGSTRKR